MNPTYTVTLVREDADDEIFVNVLTDPADFDPNARFLVLRFDRSAGTYRPGDDVNRPPAMLAIRLDDVLAIEFN